MIPATLCSTVLRGVRYSHSEATTIPAIRGKVQDVASFMKAIGRNCEEVASKFETWDQLFTTNSRSMKNDMGISTKQRKYILSWVEKYKQGAEPYAISLPNKKK